MMLPVRARNRAHAGGPGDCGGRRAFAGFRGADRAPRDLPYSNGGALAGTSRRCALGRLDVNLSVKAIYP